MSFGYYSHGVFFPNPSLAAYVCHESWGETWVSYNNLNLSPAFCVKDIHFCSVTLCGSCPLVQLSVPREFLRILVWGLLMKWASIRRKWCISFYLGIINLRIIILQFYCFLLLTIKVLYYCVSNVVFICRLSQHIQTLGFSSHKGCLGECFENISLYLLVS